MTDTQRPKCCWTSCANPARPHTHIVIDVPQVGHPPMQATLPVCSHHWLSAWQLRAQTLEVANARLANELAHLKRTLRQLADTDPGDPGPIGTVRQTWRGWKKATADG